MTTIRCPIDTTATQRQSWMQVLARAGNDLQAYGAALREHEHHYVRQAETGMVMVRGRMGGDGAPFNLGEMTVTRCVVQLNDGTTGHSYVAGRARAQAELAALADALLQGPDSQHWHETLIAPLQTAQATRAAVRAAEVAGTRVEFTTLVRGES